MSSFDFTRGLLAALAIAACVVLPRGARAADPEALWIRGQAALEGGDVDAARDAFTQLAQGYPEHPRAPDALLEVARLTLDADSARVIYGRIADDYGRTSAAAEALIAMAGADYAEGRYDQVLAKLRPAAAGHVPPDLRRRALLLLADAEIHGGRRARASEDLRRVRDLQPLADEDERALMGLAAIARASGDEREESRLLALAAHDHPDGDLAAIVLWQWARSLEAQGLSEDARARMHELVDRFPATPEGAAARDALSPEDGNAESPLPPVIEEHGAELTLWDDAAPDSGRGARAGAAESAAGPSGTPSAAAPATAVPGAANASPAESLYVVRTGRFASWRGADSLRTRMTVALRDSLGIDPGPEGTPPFAVVSRVFRLRAAAEAFARRVESALGFISLVVPAE